MYHFNRRTAEPLLPSSATGYDKADIEVPNDPVDMDSEGSSACYPQRTFYPNAVTLPFSVTGSL